MVAFLLFFAACFQSSVAIECRNDMDCMVTQLCHFGTCTLMTELTDCSANAACANLGDPCYCRYKKCACTSNAIDFSKTTPETEVVDVKCTRDAMCSLTQLCVDYQCVETSSLQSCSKNSDCVCGSCRYRRCACSATTVTVPAATTTTPKPTCRFGDNSYPSVYVANGEGWRLEISYPVGFCGSCKGCENEGRRFYFNKSRKDYDAGINVVCSRGKLCVCNDSMQCWFYESEWSFTLYIFPACPGQNGCAIYAAVFNPEAVLSPAYGCDAGGCKSYTSENQKPGDLDEEIDPEYFPKIAAVTCVAEDVCKRKPVIDTCQ